MFTMFAFDCEYSARIPNAINTRIIVVTSSRFGTLRITDLPGTMIEAARIGKAEFFDPETEISPSSLFLPLIANFNIELLWPVFLQFEIMQYPADNSFCGLAVPVRIDRMGHFFIFIFIGEQLAYRGKYFLFIHPDQSY